MADDVLRAVELYHSLGWVTVPVHFKSKQPLAKAWEQPIAAEAAHRAFSTTTLNVGIHLGTASKGLVDIDLDCQEAVALAPLFLPPTSTFGRRSNRMSHWLYLSSAPLDTKKFKDPTRKADEAMIAEIRTDRHYTVFPPSTHESGERVEFTKPLEAVPPVEIAPDALRKAVARLAACVIVIRNWPTGARHEASMSLAGGLSRCGLTDEEVLAFLDAVCSFTDDDEKADRLRAAKDTLKKLHAGRKKVSGFPALAEVMGEDPVEAIRSFLVDDSDGTLVEEFNKEFHFVRADGNVIIAQRTDNPVTGKRVINFMSTATFKEALASHYITVGKGDAIKTVKLASYWLNTPNIKPEYTGITFDPSNKVSPGVFNTWLGYSVEPKPGDWSLFHDHVLNNLCSGVQEWYDWVMAYIADALQNPTDKPGVALILQGGEGTGKTKFCDLVMSLVENHSDSIYSHEQLVGKFNSHMQDKLFLTANEAFYAGDRQHASIIRALITDKHVWVERKGKDKIRMPNYLRLMMTSNLDWLVAAARDDRRYAVFEVSNRKQQDRDYFAALDKQMDEGGREALLHHLLNLKYDRAFAKKIPQTKARERQQVMSRSEVEAWWEARLASGHPCPNCVDGWERVGHNGVDTWPEWVAKEALYRDYKATMTTGRYSNETAFWMEYYKFLGDKTAEQMLKRVRRILRTQAGEIKMGDIERLRFIRLPCHADAQKMFENYCRRKIEWPDLPGDDPNHKEDY